MLIESDGALFRCKNQYWPVDVWNEDTQHWEPYEGSRPKEAGWGDFVTPEEAKEFMEPL